MPMNRSLPASDTQGMRRRFVLTPFIAAALAPSACGNVEDPTAPQTLEGPEADVEVIRAWAEALTASDIDAAAEFFALPSQAENGLTFDIETRDDARFFNESLPCGATLEETHVEGQFITATFELTERPGRGPCPGSGNLAQTSFVIEDGAIVEWRRVAIPGDESGGQTAWQPIYQPSENRI